MRDFQKISWKDFEWFCKFFLESFGYKNVQVTPPKYDGGFDGVVFKNNKKILVEAKFWSKYGSKDKDHVPVHVVRALAGSMQQKGAQKGIIIATVPAYTLAKREAKALNIEIIDLDRLKKLLKFQKPDFDDTECPPKQRSLGGAWFSQEKIVKLQVGVVILFLTCVWIMFRDIKEALNLFLL